LAWQESDEAEYDWLDLGPSKDEIEKPKANK